MAKMVKVTKAGGALLDDKNDVVITINSDNINICEPVSEDEVGTTKVVFNNGKSINVIETQEQLQDIINA